MRLNTAVFFDFENFVINCNIENFIKKYQEQFVDRIKKETDNGEFALIKIYADWSAPRFKSLTSFLLEHGMEAVQVFGYSNTQESKNIADFMMSLDILETALTKPYIENYVICTGDAGFSVIINKLKALGKKTLVYRPERNYSRYLEKLADACIGMEAEILKRVNIKIPVSDKTVTASHPFTNNDLPQADKLNVKVMQPEFLKNLESFGLTHYEADCGKQEINEIIFGILQILTLMNIYAHPQIVASISLLALLLEHYVDKFNAKNYGHKSLSKFINSLFTGSQYKLVRRNKESQYYIVVSEEGLRKLFTGVILKPPKDEEKHAEKLMDESASEPPEELIGKQPEKPADKHLDKTPQPEKPADKQPEKSPQPEKPNGKQDKPNGKHPVKSTQKQEGNPVDKQSKQLSDKHPVKHLEEMPDKLTASPEQKPVEKKAQDSQHKTPDDKPKAFQESEKANKNGSSETQDTAVNEKENGGRHENQASNIKMNDYIRVSVALLLKKSLLNIEDFNKLLDGKYCNENFGIDHPLLKEVSTPFFPGSELYANGKKVYWKRIFKHDGRYFLIYGDWKKNSQSKRFVAWVEGCLK